ncbi:hypothetical protein O6H91_12G077700 [Diphasiastrum complanatum]|uniref:Uncharacterized protein n=1 Tax=Diphasiastrum complanatum TaxID=34168 RepID=A0ACC2C4W9_DIPCM|nr:hypothetical protein O6H91_12G077700 [Diphasiastrum complanatum]
MPLIDSSAVAAQKWSRGEMRLTMLALRCMTTLLSAVALGVLVADKETRSISINFPGLNQPLVVSKTARYSQSKALQFYVAANAIVASYSVLQALRSLFLMLASLRPATSKASAWTTYLLDQALAYLLLSALGASSEVAYLAKKGNTNVGWNELCSMFGHYCNLVGASVIAGSLAFLQLVIISGLSAYHLFYKTYGTGTSSQKEEPK